MKRETPEVHTSIVYMDFFAQDYPVKQEYCNGKFVKTTEKS